jgi:4-amino-4-deoxy-L-arabinose transferase-like glycosyltransferase
MEFAAQPVSVSSTRRRRRGPPRSLAILMVATALLGVTWALVVPAWQSPDEPQHFAYAQSLATRFALPGDKHRRSFSSAQGFADAVVGASRGAFYPDAVPPDWSASDYARYRAALAGNPSASDGGGPNSAAANPPLYYLYASIAYWVSGGGSDALDQLYAMRIWDVALLLITVAAAWLLSGEVLGPRRDAQLVCAAVAGLVPAETFVSTSVNPDSLMVALWALALWLGARVITRAGRRSDSVALGLVTAAAVLTKATSYALVPAALLALLLGWRLQPSAERQTITSQFAVPLAALAAPILGWLALAAALGRSAVNTIQTGPGAHSFNIRQFLSYLWQFYLPRLPFMTRFRETSQLPLYDLWIREGWGVFGWRDLAMPDWIYKVCALVSAAVAVGGAVIVARFRDRLRLALLAFFALALIALLVGLHVTDYRAIIAGQSAVIQGRYLLPVLPLFGLAVGLIVTRIPAAWRTATAGGILAVLLVLQVVALSSVATGYYT